MSDSEYSVIMSDVITNFDCILTSVDSDEPVQSPFKPETPNDVRLVA